MKVKNIIKKYLGKNILAGIKDIEDHTGTEEKTFNIKNILNNIISKSDIYFNTNSFNNKPELIIYSCIEKNFTEPFLHYIDDRFIIDWNA